VNVPSTRAVTVRDADLGVIRSETRTRSWFRKPVPATVTGAVRTMRNSGCPRARAAAEAEAEAPSIAKAASAAGDDCARTSHAAVMRLSPGGHPAAGTSRLRSSAGTVPPESG
jgi:hypothetical protein